MSHPEELKQWASDVSRHMPKLSKTEAWVLALYSLGIVVTGSSGITSISQLWAEVYEKSVGAYRQRLREWSYEAEAKRGGHRQEIDVTRHFGEILRWILSYWQGPSQLALVMDATHLTHRFTVLCVSVVYRGCAIPVAWKIVGGQEQGEWKPYWMELLELLRGHVPDNWTVIVLTDRGLYARWLYRAIQRCGWHPVMRINALGLYKRPQ